MKIVTSREMQAIDQKTIRNYGIPAKVLMERAGLAVAKKIKELFEKRKVLVLSGGGNNGGDGMVAARNLHEWGWDVKVLLLSDKNKLSNDCLLQYETALRAGVPVEFRKKIDRKDLHAALVIDAIFGTGLGRDVKGNIAEIISFLNSLVNPVVAVDIPSGISSDTGQVMGEAVRADHTVTFGLPKRGHILHPGAEYAGNLFIEDIGFPEELVRSKVLKIELLEKKDVSLLIPERPKYSHKGDYGHVFVVAGSKGKTGAALMCARACLRAGAGLVTIGVPESLMDIFQSRVTEEMTLPLPDAGDGTLSSDASEEILDFISNSADVLAIGPGISNTDETGKVVSSVLMNSTVPSVVDADAINALSNAKDIFKKAISPLILTPHPGEMARLLKKCSRVQGLKGSREIEKDRINTAIKFAKDTGICLVLKGVPTVIAGPDENIYLNQTGNPGMATAGVGDALTGIIAAFLGQGLNPLEASILGVYMHGVAGDIAADKKGEHSLIATDIIDSLPDVFLLLKSK